MIKYPRITVPWLISVMLIAGAFIPFQSTAATQYRWKAPRIDGDFNDPNRWTSGLDSPPSVPKAGDDAGMSGDGPSLSHTVTILGAPELRYTYIAYNAIHLLDRFVVTGTNFVQGAPCIISGPGTMDAAFFEAISDFDIDQATVKIGTLEHRNYDITVKIKNSGLLDTTRDTSINGYTLNVIVEGSGSRWQNATHAGPRVSLTVRNGMATLPSFDGYLLKMDGGKVSLDRFSTTLQMTGGELVTTSGNVFGFETFMRGGQWTASGVITNQSDFIAENGAVIKSGGGAVASRFFVRGAGTLWEVGDLQFLNGALLTEQGGRVVPATEINLGKQPDQGGSISVSGAGSRVVLSRNLNVGVRTPFGTVTVRDQGALDMAGGSVGQESGGEGLIMVSGAGAKISIGATLRVGESGKGQVTVDRGGALSVGSSGQLDLGTHAGSQGEVSVSGGGSTLESTGRVNVGRKGKGTFNVQGGALVTLGALGIGESDESNRVTVAESGSKLDVTGAFEIGQSGTGHLNVNTGGTVISGQATLGVAADTLGTATIQGRGSVMQVRRDLTIGGRGQGETFVLSGGALSVQSGALNLGGQEGSFGLLTVDGAASKLDVPAGAVRVGVESLGRLTISRGAVVNSQSAQLAIGDGQAQVTVGQDDATWNITGTLEVGVGDAATLRIDKNALVQAGQGFVARQSGSLGALQAIGDGARLIFDQGLTVGEDGAGLLEVASGGSVKITSGEFVVGAGEGAEGLVTVGNSPGTLDAETSPTIIAEAGTGKIFVLPQGLFTSGAARMAVERDSTGIVSITGRQARWRVRGPLTVGVQGNATLQISGKGTLEASGEVNVGSKGRLCGDGTVKATVVANNGELCPGASPGLLAIEGDFQQKSSGLLEIEFAGTTAGETHDLLTVTGNVTLDGTLRLKFIDAFAPRNGQTFTFLNASSNLLGTFPKVEISGLAAGFQYDLVKVPGAFRFVARSDAIPTSASRLKIESAGASIVLSWQGLNTSQLEASNDLSNPLGWSPVITPPITSTNGFSLSLPANAIRQFFRLRQR